MSYDRKCEELAEHFLPDAISRAIVELLAQRIQDFVEAELRFLAAAIQEELRGKIQ